MGDDPATNTLLRYLSVSGVTEFAMSQVQIRGVVDSGISCPDISGIEISESSATLTDCAIARIGAKFCNTRGRFGSSTVEMVDCLVTGNIRPREGGLLVAGGELTVRRSTIAKNLGLDSGGGLHVTEGAIVKLLDGTIVTDNRAGQAGGGIYVDAGATVTISSDSLVTGNRDVNGNPSNCAGDGTIDGICGPTS